MAHSKVDSQEGTRQTPEPHHKRGMFGKVKDKLDFTKHLGFQSGPDSLANLEALANVREREERKAQDSEQNPEQEPKHVSSAGTRDSEGGLNGTETARTSAPREEQEMQGEHNPVSMNEEVEKRTSSQKDHEGSEVGWGRWVAHKVHQVSRAAASKDLSDELLKNKPKTRAGK